ncbi:MAG: alpha-glucosidase [Exilispira sp.]
MKKRIFKFISFIFILSSIFILFSCSSLQSELKNEQIVLKNNLLLNIDSKSIQIFSGGKEFVKFPVNNSFINAFEKDYIYQYHMASINIKEKIRKSYKFQKISSVEKIEETLIIKGFIAESSSSNQMIDYTLKIIPYNEYRIDFELSIENEKINQISLKFISYPDEKIFGGGVQYSFLDLKGKKVPILTSEQGVGRGDQPITFGANLTQKAGGNNFTTYFPIPYFFTSRLRAFYFENSGYGEFDFSNKNNIDVKFLTDKTENRLSGSFFIADSYKNLISLFSEINGKMPILPDWTYGTILGIQGGSTKVTTVVDDLINQKNPVTAIWIQDWCGKRITSFGQQLKWRWYPDEELYPDFKNFVKLMESKGVKVLGYINPFLADRDPKKTGDDFTNPLLEEAREKDYLVKNKEGKPYLIQTVGFPAYMLDLTNPEAVKWIKNIIKENLIGNGLSGWMADFGEWLPMDAVLHSGISAELFHNQYPVIWAKINREAIQEAKKEGEIVFFARAGFTKSPSYSTLFWLGDQMVSFGKNDGLPSAILGSITASLSGIPFIHSDIGGYTTITNPIMTYHRSKELLLRWIEFEAFTPVYRTHEGNQPLNNWQVYQYSDANATIKSDEETVKFYNFFAQIHFKLKDYFKKYIEIASNDGIPVIRALFINFPSDDECYNIKYQFMIGDDLLVAPVIKEKSNRMKVYLPEGKWIHAFTKKVYDGKRYVEIDTPLGKPAVFILAGGENEKMLLDIFSQLK